MRNGIKLKLDKKVIDFIKSHNAMRTSSEQMYYTIDSIFKETEEEDVLEVFCDIFDYIANNTDGYYINSKEK